MHRSESDCGPSGSSTTISSFSANACLFKHEDFAALLGMAQDQAQDRAIGRIGDRQADDLDPSSLKRTVDLEQLAHPVFQEDGVLGHGRPASSLKRLELDFAAAIVLAITHEVPRGACSTLARNGSLSLRKFSDSKGLGSMVRSQTERRCGLLNKRFRAVAGRRDGHRR